jgi:hypothetical protein
LRNVAFLVVPDAQLAQFSSEVHGAIGLPVLMAFERLRWTPEGDLEFGFPSSEKGEANLCFDGWGVVARIEFQGRRLMMALDTGSPGTEWWPAFASAFPEIADRNGKRESRHVGGSPGDASVESIIVPRLSLRIGSMDVTQNDAPVNLAKTGPNGGFYFGNLGIGLLDQAHRVTLDLKSLRLTLE